MTVQALRNVRITSQTMPEPLVHVFTLKIKFSIFGKVRLKASRTHAAREEHAQNAHNQIY